MIGWRGLKVPGALSRDRAANQLYPFFSMSYPIFLAEGERFELSEDFRPRWFSRPVHSTALPPLRRVGILLYFRWRNIFASNQDVQAIPGATIVVSPNPSLAIHGESFGPQKASLFVGFADRVSPSLVFKTSAFNRSATPPADGNLTTIPAVAIFFNSIQEVEVNTD